MLDKSLTSGPHWSTVASSALAILLILGLGSGDATAATRRAQPEPPSFAARVSPLGAVPTTVMPAVDVAALLAEDAAKARTPGPLRMAAPIHVDLSAPPTELIGHVQDHQDRFLQRQHGRSQH